MMRIPPAMDGHGGSQRAWGLVSALSELAPVHFVLLSRKCDLDAQTVSLAPLRALVKSVTSIDVPEWMPLTESWADWMSPRACDWANLLRTRSQEAPRLSSSALQRISDQLPIRSADLLFAGRIPTAVIAQQLIDKGFISARRKVVDFDDIMSRFRQRQVRAESANMGRHWTALGMLDAKLIEHSERQIATGWDGVSVCSDDDVELLKKSYPKAQVLKVPNVISRPLLAERPAPRTPRILFVGNLSFGANIQGLQAFVDEAWPQIKALSPEAKLVIAGMNPNAWVLQLAQSSDVELHVAPPILDPYYADSDVVIAPILFGGGTRIKILEAMAYGRPVVSTTIGAEGLGAVAGRDIEIADDMSSFADAVTRLLADPQARRRQAGNARALQEAQFGPEKMRRAVAQMVNTAVADGRPEVLPELS